MRNNIVPEQAVPPAGDSSDPRATNSSIREESPGMAPEAGQSIVWKLTNDSSVLWESDQWQLSIVTQMQVPEPRQAAQCGPRLHSGPWSQQFPCWAVIWWQGGYTYYSLKQAWNPLINTETKAEIRVGMNPSQIMILFWFMKITLEGCFKVSKLCILKCFVSCKRLVRVKDRLPPSSLSPAQADPSEWVGRWPQAGRSLDLDGRQPLALPGQEESLGLLLRRLHAWQWGWQPGQVLRSHIAHIISTW